ncbi:heme exporter protein CcmD [Coralloluteibacterium stylophorae]|uniref:Heme exporter protein D n=1 Tax=Coralloluteibacterium stylophorae TaxID=1776034 RepID=A0A8J7VWL7_9GAMM|nr:heme exporter protein CcmD [Coralloluteibacterium stylophorae]MBS7457554.1 heme exporter protein CcmD [Coralloluteibacterium stylophorae]
MSYAGYVLASYAVFALVLLWDGLSPRIRLARTRQRIAARARRDAARRSAGTTSPSTRDTTA